MRHRLPELVGLMGDAGLSDPDGFPLRALMAAIGEAESEGDPNAWVAHDPPTNPKAGPSSGLYQVHQPYWPTIYRDTEAVRLDPSLSDADKIVFMTELAKPIMANMLSAAMAAARTLAARGIPAGALNTALFVDAAWQSGGDHLARWAQHTRTGDPREIVNATRTINLEASLRDLAAGPLGVTSGLLVAAGVFGAFGLAALVLSQLDI